MKNVLKTAVFTALAAFLLSSCSSEQKEFRPESSSLFEERIDPESGVVSYSLKCGYPDDNRQSLYFVTKSMTEDGRFRGRELMVGGDGKVESRLGHEKGAVTVGLIAVLMVLFQFFNQFVNSTFNYLFNDVVPQSHIGRFAGAFRIVGTAVSALYNFFIFLFLFIFIII